MWRSLIPDIKNLYSHPPKWAVLTFWGGITGLIFVAMLIPLEIAAFWQGRGSLACLLMLLLPGLSYHIVKMLWGDLASLIVLPMPSLLAATTVGDMMGPDGVSLHHVLMSGAMGALLPWLIYWAALTLWLVAVFTLGVVFQLIAWAGRASRGESLFDDVP